VTYDYESISRLAKTLHRPAETLIVQTKHSDPFFAGLPYRRKAAEWFAELWNRFGFGPGTHIRRMHYILVSHGSTIVCPDGTPYENTAPCWTTLSEASKGARYLGLVPAGDFVDRRNDEPYEYLAHNAAPASVSVSEATGLATTLGLRINDTLAELPDFDFTPPFVDQGYHVEIWCEKSTMNDILLPLAQEYDNVNVITGTGEISTTHCYNLVQRAEASGRPVRILYISDFDPGGMSMPVAAARKIEFFIRCDNLDLDVQVRPIVLTHDQCIEYRLPRTPIKETEARGARFEARFGEGATELDALEALHPGVLRQLLQDEIARYHDGDLDDRVDAEADDFREGSTMFATRFCTVTPMNWRRYAGITKTSPGRLTPTCARSPSDTASGSSRLPNATTRLRKPSPKRWSGMCPMWAMSIGPSPTTATRMTTRYSIQPASTLNRLIVISCIKANPSRGGPTRARVAAAPEKPRACRAR
jgi:hypothetical protein